jgi:hypothetical protein
MSVGTNLRSFGAPFFSRLRKPNEQQGDQNALQLKTPLWLILLPCPSAKFARTEYASLPAPFLHLGETPAPKRAA